MSNEIPVQGAITAAPTDPDDFLITRKEAKRLRKNLRFMKERIERLEAIRDRLVIDRTQGYIERNRLVAFIAKVYPGSHLVEADETAYPDTDEDKIRLVRAIACIHFPHGHNATFHFSPEDEIFFEGLEYAPSDWDGHTTEEKYELFNLMGNAALARNRTLGSKTTGDHPLER